MLTVNGIARTIHVQGRVQGVGFRPAVYRWAMSCDVAGFVSNDSRGVSIHVEGDEFAVERFANGLHLQFPAQAVISHLRTEPTERLRVTRFVIRDSEKESSLSTLVPPDRAICSACVHELFDPQNRRYRHPFISCTDCGPRFSILQSMPFDRARTSLNGFPLCSECREEYENPADRRFHAQTISCSNCGPRLSFVTHDGSIPEIGYPAIQAACEILQQQGVLALKGLGGYQLLVDATSTIAIERLRSFKKRPGKALAIMVRDLATAESLAHVHPAERQWLESAENPIVLLRRRDCANLAHNLAPNLRTVGIMLPTTPMHALLLRELDFPLIVTSGNREGEPLISEEALAQRELRDIADGWLHHDRPIIHPLDDSVLSVIRERPCVIRLARGIAPLPLKLPLDKRASVLAVGGEQKAAIALSNGEQAILGPHIGDLHGLETIRRWQQASAAYPSLYQTTPELMAYDFHPDYYSTRWATQQALPGVRVQHHQAHLAAVLLEHARWDEPTLGFAWDGTGWGDDGSIWGGECFMGTVRELNHISQLRPFSLLGGEQAVREPWRCAASVLSDCNVDLAPLLARMGVSPASGTALFKLVQQPRLSPRTSSMGRLFDAAAALILHRTQVSYEGQAALELEHACEETDCGSYPFLWDFQATPSQLDWRVAFQQLVADLQANVPPSVMAMRFHRGLAQAVMALSDVFPQLPLALSGGVFQNRVLVSLIAELCERAHRTLLWGGLIPPGDGGLAAGQLAITLLNQPASEGRT